MPLAAESLGVRSMCTYVETPDVRILLDAGVSLCPYRFGLPPHPTEFKTIEVRRKEIADAATQSDVVTISHYHFDHHTPSFEDWICNWTRAEETAQQIYEEKTVLLKNFRENINYSQRRRGWVFRKTGGKYAKKLETADGREFTFGDTKIRFSEPVFHGAEHSFLGWVLIITIQHGREKFMFAPDVQGPMSQGALHIILSEKPHFLILGGPPIGLAGSRVSSSEISVGMRNLQKVVENIPTVVLEHHILRDENWREKSKDIFDAAHRLKTHVLTAAEFLGRENMFLESSRRSLYEDLPPAEEFNEWKRQLGGLRHPPKPPI